MDSDLLSSLSEIFTNFRTSIFLGFAAVCYLFIQVIKGKFLGIRIPYITSWLEGKGSTAKRYILWGLFGIAGGLVSASTGISFWKILNGIIAGLSVGVTTTGLHSSAKEMVTQIKNYRNNAGESPQADENPPVDTNLPPRV